MRTWELTMYMVGWKYGELYMMIAHTVSKVRI
jgi:hypothetical protein